MPVTQMPRTVGHPWVLSALFVLSACSVLSGADGYAEVPRCTGPLCGVCGEGQAPCGGLCCGSGERCADPDTQVCVPACGPDLFECGLTCCGRADHCVELGGPNASKGRRCSACERAEDECGPSCCVAGEACTDRVRGVCGATWPAANAHQSCGAGLVCALGASCCTSISVPGGEFPMGRSLLGTDSVSAGSPWANELPEHSVTISTYSLDQFEVTVGRFRQFVERWDYAPPPAGAAANAKVPGSGWRTAWNDQLARTRSDLEDQLGCGKIARYTKTAGATELMPLNCVSWYHAFVFCAWDGGRLPTEAEWEYAAANGAKNDRYPWGATYPTTAHASFGCAAPCVVEDVKAVGSFPLGANRWGHLDLAGNMNEWTLDLFDLYGSTPQTDPGIVGAGGGVRSFRGGDTFSLGSDLRAARRNGDAAGSRYGNVGFRCARSL